MNEFEKDNLINKLANDLDITPEMYQRAVSISNGLSDFLKEKNYTAEVYKQGSFRLGTIVRPYKDGEDKDYDVDLVVKFKDIKQVGNHKEIKKRLGGYLANSPYKDKLREEKRRCYTLEFAESNGVGFHVDLLPALQENSEKIQSLKTDKNAEIINTAIAITERDPDNEEKYSWKTSNPKGYAKWFHEINQTYSGLKQQDKQRLLQENTNMSTEFIDDLARTPLQKVIQIIKRHRDVYFSEGNYDDRPASIIITTLSAKIVEENKLSNNIITMTSELLDYIVKGFAYYSSLTISGITSDFQEEFKNKKLIQKIIVNGKPKWKIENPANPGENLADKWNDDDSNKAALFFKWVNTLANDLVDILEGTIDNVKSKFKFCLGEAFTQSFFARNKFQSTSTAKEIKVDSNSPKPYKVC